MVAFWDSSALVAAFIQEATSVRARELLTSTDALVFWWGTRVEVAHAVGRRRNDGSISADEASLVRTQLDVLFGDGYEVEPSAGLLQTATATAFAGTLRSADSLQFAAGLEAQRSVPLDAFVTFDDRLAEVARTRGLTVLGRTP